MIDAAHAREPERCPDVVRGVIDGRLKSVRGLCL